MSAMCACAIRRRRGECCFRFEGFHPVQTVVVTSPCVQLSDGNWLVFTRHGVHHTWVPCGRFLCGKDRNVIIPTVVAVNAFDPHWPLGFFRHLSGEGGCVVAFAYVAHDVGFAVTFVR